MAFPERKTFKSLAVVGSLLGQEEQITTFRHVARIISSPQTENSTPTSMLIRLARRSPNSLYSARNQA